MSSAYVVGHVTVKDEGKWAEYRNRVPATLAPWGAELVFRGRQVEALAGDSPHPDIVVIRFPSVRAINGWYSSPAYQALVPLRQEAAELVLISYETLREPAVQSAGRARGRRVCVVALPVGKCFDGL